MSLWKVGRTLVRNFIKVAKQVAPTTASNNVTVCYTKLVPYKVYSRRANFLWNNIHGFCYNTAASNLRRKACSTFLRRNAKFSLLSFVGLYLTENENQTATLADFIQTFQSTFKYSFQNVESADQLEYPTSVDEYKIIERLGKPSSDAAVYAADCHGRECALKMMFNYAVPSNSLHILQAFSKEYSLLSSNDNENVGLEKHPNIIKLLGKYVDKIPLMYDSFESYPLALPKDLSPHGIGRSRTLFLVMPKYTSTLREYLSINKDTLTFQKRLYVFCQLLEGVSHLEHNSISHRDLKTDNVLLDFSLDESFPQLVITDFGCCLANKDKGMEMLFQSWDVDLGGNAALMAPEIINAVPQEGLYLDYSKADVWSVGTIAYEIFKQENPFYGLLQNTDYCEEDLPSLSSSSPIVDHVVQDMLCKDPNKRLSATEAATILFLFLFAPLSWLADGLSLEEVNSWLLKMSILTMRKCLKIGDKSIPVDVQLHLVFLSRISVDEIFAALSLLRNILK